MDIAAQLRKDLADHWEKFGDESHSTICSPAISVMTVKRALITSFPIFQQLPAELQDIAWGYALQTPRIIAIAHWEYEKEPFWTTERQPPLMRVCRSSSRFAMQQCVRGLPGKDHLYYNLALDTIRLDINTLFDVRAWSKYNIKSIGIRTPSGMGFPSSKHFAANDAKVFRGLREIVILTGSPRSASEMQLDDVDESSVPTPNRQVNYDEYDEMTGARDPLQYANRLRWDLRKVS